MDKFKLTERHNDVLLSGIIRFYVPVGMEKEWEKKFEEYELVEWAELNYYADINPWP